MNSHWLARIWLHIMMLIGTFSLNLLCRLLWRFRNVFAVILLGLSRRKVEKIENGVFIAFHRWQADDGRAVGNRKSYFLTLHSKPKKTSNPWILEHHTNFWIWGGSSFTCLSTSNRLTYFLDAAINLLAIVDYSNKVWQCTPTQFDVLQKSPFYDQLRSSLATHSGLVWRRQHSSTQFNNFLRQFYRLFQSSCATCFKTVCCLTPAYRWLTPPTHFDN